MTDITVPAHGGGFANQFAGLRVKLIELVAERENLPINGDFRPSFYRSKAEQLADALIAAFERDPGGVVDADVSAILQAMADNHKAWLTQRQAGTEARDRMVQDQANAAQAAEPPTHYALRFLDLNTGREVEITVPVDQVKFLMVTA